MGIAEHHETTAPTREDAAIARDSSSKLSKFAGRVGRDKSTAGGDSPRFRLQVQAEGDHPEEETVRIPAPAFRLIMDILNQMALGNAVTVIPVHAELTTQQAAEVLNVSRPFVIKLIEDGKLPCKMVGTHRRLLFSDLMEYKRTTDAERLKVLEELSSRAQDLGMGY